MKLANLLKNANDLKAEDLTFASTDYIVNLVGRETGMTLIAEVKGTAGTTAALVKGKLTGKFYYVTRRNPNLFVVL